MKLKEIEKYSAGPHALEPFQKITNTNPSCLRPFWCLSSSANPTSSHFFKFFLQGYKIKPRLSGMAIFSQNGRVNSCYHGHRNVYLLRMRRHPHTLLFINSVGGARRGLSIQLSGIFSYPASQGVQRFYCIALFQEATII